MGAAVSLPEPPPCRCTSDHRPAVLRPDAHHLWPVYLGGPEVQQTMLGLCQTTHANVHRILRAMVKARRLLPRDPGTPRYAHHVASLGFLAWQAAGEPTPRGATAAEAAYPAYGWHQLGAVPAVPTPPQDPDSSGTQEAHNVALAGLPERGGDPANHRWRYDQGPGWHQAARSRG